MSEVPDLGQLVRRLEAQMEDEFPNWRIIREDSGTWTATLAGWGRLYGESAAELRERLRRHAKGTTDDDA